MVDQRILELAKNAQSGGYRRSDAQFVGAIACGPGGALVRAILSPRVVDLQAAQPERVADGAHRGEPAKTSPDAICPTEPPGHR